LVEIVHRGDPLVRELSHRGEPLASREDHRPRQCGVDAVRCGPAFDIDEVLRSFTGPGRAFHDRYDAIERGGNVFDGRDGALREWAGVDRWEGVDQLLALAIDLPARLARQLRAERDELAVKVVEVVRDLTDRIS